VKLLKHALRQAQRRAIDPKVVDLVLSYGEDFKAGKGCRFYRIPSSQMKFIKEDCPPPLWKRYRDHMNKIAAIVSENDNVVTTMHRYKPLWK